MKPIKRTPEQLEALISLSEGVIRSQLGELVGERDTARNRYRRRQRVKSRARHLVHHCLDKPVGEHG